MNESTDVQINQHTNKNINNINGRLNLLAESAPVPPEDMTVSL